MMQLSGSTESWNLKGGPIIFMARAFSNALYNETKYLDQINKQTEIDCRKERIERIGRKIALCLLIVGIIVGVSFCSKIETYLDVDNSVTTYKSLGNSAMAEFAKAVGSDFNYKDGEVPFYIVLFLILGSIVAFISSYIISGTIKNTYDESKGK